MKNILNQNSKENLSNKIDWKVVQSEMKSKFGLDIYESWLKKIDFVDEFTNYILLSVSTRFIRDWITSRYLDQIFQIVKVYKKDIRRIEFLVSENKNILETNTEEKNDKEISKNQNISFIKDSYLQYNRIDQNKKFENFIIGSSNKLAFEASKKVAENLAHYNPLYLYGGVGMGKSHLLNAMGLRLKDKTDCNEIFSQKLS